MTFSEKAQKYFLHLDTHPGIPGDVTVMNPYTGEAVRDIVKTFYNKFYSDAEPRIYIMGINPGRFGGGLTGISFTDPVALREYCGIANNMGDRRELSSEFIYRVIEAYGGAEKFFRIAFLTALYPLALLKNGKNYNFYDDKKTFSSLFPYIVSSVREQVSFGARRDKVISLGSKNAEILGLVNKELNLFGNMEVLDHPRYIMQYKRKYLGDYIKKYLRAMNI